LGGDGSLEPPDMIDMGPLPPADEEPIEFGDTLGAIPETFEGAMLEGGAAGLGRKMLPYS